MSIELGKGQSVAPEKQKNRLVSFVQNTENVANLAFLNMVLSGANFYKDAQLSGAMEKMATEVDPFFKLAIFFLFVSAGTHVLAAYERTKEK